MSAQESSGDRVRISMLKQDYEAILANAERNGQSLSGYLSRAIARNRYIDDGLRNGDTFGVERNGSGVMREIIFF